MSSGKANPKQHSADDSSGIQGVQVVPLPVFRDDRGAVSRMLRATDPHFVSFGEIYFSTINRNITKAWKNHKTVTANYACVHGRVRFVLYDSRPGSPTEGRVLEVEIGSDAYALVVVPPGVWNGFHGLASPASIVASCSTEVYDPEEFERIDPDDPLIPYRWPE